jgi:hypothetical protein
VPEASSEAVDRAPITLSGWFAFRLVCLQVGLKVPVAETTGNVLLPLTRLETPIHPDNILTAIVMQLQLSVMGMHQGFADSPRQMPCRSSKLPGHRAGAQCP